MIKIQNITKSYGQLQVLKGIDLCVEKGEVVSIVGPSGAGKTTLLQIMGTLDRPDSATSAPWSAPTPSSVLWLWMPTRSPRRLPA